MSGRKPAVYWDSCIFTAWIKNEKREPGEMEGVETIARLVNDRHIYLMTSTITRVEVLASSMNEEQERIFSKFFRSDSLSLIAPDIRVVTLASELRDFFIKSPDYDKTLGTPDAIHLASAIIYQATEFHTFDKKGRGKTLGLLPLSGKVANYPLKICKPSAQPKDWGWTQAKKSTSDDAEQLNIFNEEIDREEPEASEDDNAGAG